MNADFLLGAIKSWLYGNCHYMPAVEAAFPRGMSQSVSICVYLWRIK
jgi:hypothetical protein